MSRLRIGHTALNHSLYKMGKHESGLCVKCDLPETVEHILIECKGYDNERLQLIEALHIEINQISLQKLLNKDITIDMFYILFKYLKDTELINRIKRIATSKFNVVFFVKKKKEKFFSFPLTSMLHTPS